jgi:hypothetical protein
VALGAGRRGSGEIPAGAGGGAGRGRARGGLRVARDRFGRSREGRWLAARRAAAAAAASRGTPISSEVEVGATTRAALRAPVGCREGSRAVVGCRHGERATQPVSGTGAGRRTGRVQAGDARARGGGNALL